DDHILPAIVVEIAEMCAERQRHEAWRPDRGALRLVTEEVVTRISIEGVHLKRVVCDEEVHSAIVIVIAGGDAHTGLRSAVHSEGNTLLDAVLMKRAVA